MTQTIRLRPAEPEDVAEMLQLLAEFDLPPFEWAGQPHSSYTVAESAGKLVGTAGLEMYRETGLLRSVAVSRDWQGQAIGRQLVAERLSAAASVGTTALFLLTLTADRFFARFGFVPVPRESVPSEIRRSKEFSTLCPMSAVVMKLTIDWPFNAHSGPG